jgi:hypothetical protein
VVFRRYPGDQIMSVPIRKEWIERAVPGRTFAEVGGLWGTVNEQVTVAAKGGARDVTMIDIAPDSGPEGYLWDRFRERCRTEGVENYRCIRADINDAAAAGSVGIFETVHCSGVLYHCPEPLDTLRQLGRICSETLILGTATIPEVVSTTAGTVVVAPGSALLVPAMNYSQKCVLGEYLSQVGANQAIGVNYPIATDWDPNDYAAWWWFFTRDYVAALLEAAGFVVEDVASYWEGRATLYQARKKSAARAVGRAA